jgi:hypothetical protein
LRADTCSRKVATFIPDTAIALAMLIDVRRIGRIVTYCCGGRSSLRKMQNIIAAI